MRMKMSARIDLGSVIAPSGFFFQLLFSFVFINTT